MVEAFLITGMLFSVSKVNRESNHNKYITENNIFYCKTINKIVKSFLKII